METKPAFNEVESQIQQHYASGAYGEALALAERMAPHFPERSALFYYWRICMAARLEDTPQTLRLLNEVLQSGQWYSDILLRKSPSLLGIQGQPDFERLVARNNQAQAEDPEHLYPVITLRSQGECTLGGPACPFLVGLHGNTSTALESVPFWRGAAGAGWLVAVPQSTQALWKGAFVWNDYDVSREQLHRHITSIQRQYALDPERFVIGGHSMGGEVAIRLVLSGELQATGFIAIGPGGPLVDDPEQLTPLIEAAAGSGLRGYFILGDEDSQVWPENIQKLIDRLNESAIPTNLEIVPGATHDFNPDYEEALLRGLDFIILE